MSQSGTFIPQEVLQTNLNEKDTKKMQRETHNEIKEEKKKEKIKRSLCSRVENVILEGDAVFLKEINKKSSSSFPFSLSH